jgi:hypothetical protein
MVVVVLQSVGPWLGKWGCGWFVGVHHPKLRSFGVFAYGDREFLVFWDVFKRCYYSFGRGVSEVVAIYFCVPPYFM